MKYRLLSAVLASLLGAAALPALAQGADQKASGGAATSGPSGNARPINELQQAAQRLREAVQAMAQAPAGDQRTQAIKAGNQALMEVHGAMANLPPNLITAQADESHYKKAMDRLQQAAQRLREAAQALAQQPAGERRSETIKQINDAILETQQVMLDLPMHRTSK